MAKSGSWDSYIWTQLATIGANCTPYNPHELTAALSTANPTSKGR